MPVTVLLARYDGPDAPQALDERELELDALPEVGDVLWLNQPYAVRRVGDEAPARVEAELDAERWLRLMARLPLEYTLNVFRPAGLGAFDAVVGNVEGGVRGYGRHATDGQQAAEAALRDARL